MNASIEMDIEGHRLAATLIHANDRGTPVFFLHGVGGSIHFWTPGETSLFQNLGACYSLSLPGHFPAIFPRDFPASCITAEMIARLLACAIQEIVGARKVLFVGHSMGGFAALCTAISAPEVVAGIVCVAGFAKGRWTGPLGFNQWLVRQGSIGRAIFKSQFQLGGLNPAIFRMFWHVYAHDHLALLKDAHFKSAVHNTFAYVRKLDLEAMANYFTVMPNIDITPGLSRIAVPTCVIFGDNDPIVSPGQSSIIAEKIANSNLTIIRSCGHLPFWEKPMQYRHAILPWLAALESVLAQTAP